MRLVLPGLSLLLSAAVFAMLCGPGAIMLLHKILALPPAFILVRECPLAALSLAALPLGVLGAAGLAAATRPLRLCASGLLVLALLTLRLPPEHATLNPLLASTAIVMLILTPPLTSVDPVLLDAAAASGASPWDRLMLIILPRITGPCLAAFLICLAADATFWLFPS